MPNFTSSLPEATFKRLENESKRLKIPKNKIIDKALNYYLEKLERDAYILAFKKLESDGDMLDLANEGLDDYVIELKEWDE
jgi:predicted DNA-binding protein